MSHDRMADITAHSKVATEPRCWQQLSLRRNGLRFRTFFLACLVVVVLGMAGILGESVQMAIMSNVWDLRYDHHLPVENISSFVPSSSNNVMRTDQVLAIPPLQQLSDAKNATFLETLPRSPNGKIIEIKSLVPNSTTIGTLGQQRSNVSGENTNLLVPSGFWNKERVNTIVGVPLLPCVPSEKDIFPLQTTPSMIRGVAGRRTVISIPPAEIMRSWDLPDLADDYELAEKGRWYKTAARWAAKMPYKELVQAAGQNSYVAAGAKGNYEEAAMSISLHFNGQNVSEPWPGVMVLRNAFFSAGTQAVHDCSTSWFGGCWRIRPGILDNMISIHKRCTPGANLTATPMQRYEFVVALQNSKNPFFYHFMTESISRAFLLADLIKANPKVKFVGLVSRRFMRFTYNSFDFMGIDRERLVIDGCADYLLVPEDTKCKGLDMPMLNLIRAYITMRLRVLRPPILNRTAAGYKYIILVKRPRSRSVENHDQLLQGLTTALNGTHDVVVHGSSPTFIEQYALFHGASAVVGPHGAGLSLVMAMKRGSGVVEFVTSIGQTNLCYLYLSAKLELNYLAILPPNAAFEGSFNVSVTHTVNVTRQVLELDSV